MKKSTTALSLAALIAAGGIYYTSTTVASAFAAETIQHPPGPAYSTEPATAQIFVAIPGPSTDAAPLAALDPQPGCACPDSAVKRRHLPPKVTCTKPSDGAGPGAISIGLAF